MDFVYKKISKNTYHLINKDPIKLELPISYIPFGLDNTNNKYAICFSINNKNKEGLEVLNIIEEVEKYFQSLDFIIDTDKEKILLSNKKFVSNIKQNKNFYPNIKTFIRKINNNINTKIFNKNSLGTIFDIQPKMKCTGIIELGTLWYTNDTYGLLWYINEIILLD